MTDDVRRDLREALKLVAATLKRGNAPFALAGGYALWARGGPEPLHDVDFIVAEEDAAVVAEHLAAEGLTVVQPPEDWLFKVYVDHALVDVIHRTSGVPVLRERFDGVEEIEVGSVQMPVVSATDAMTDKLNAMEEHACDFGAVIPVVRAVREQVDWDVVRVLTRDNDFAVALLFLLERLGVVDPADDVSAGSGPGTLQSI